MDQEKRMAGQYEIIHAFRIGAYEVVIGENPNAQPDEVYMCALCQENELIRQYSEMMVSDDYAEIAELFGQRIAAQAMATQQALFRPKDQGIDESPITECTPRASTDDLHDRIVVIRPEVLRREYRKCTHQLKVCTGGFGASPNSRGSACFCVDIYSGKTSRFERYEILGTMTEDQLPKWAQLHLDMYRDKHRAEQEAR